MDEARRFLRHIVPGILSALLTMTYLWLSFPRSVSGMSADDIDSAALVISAVLASGALGYMWSIVHHMLYHTPLWRRLGLTVDISGILARAQDIQVIPVGAQGTEKRIDPSSLSSTDAWAALSVFWYSRGKPDNSLGRALPRTTSLFDLVHASGTLFVATITALAAWAVVVAMCHQSAMIRTTVLAGIAGFAICVLLFFNTRSLARTAGVVLEGCLWQFLDEDRSCTSNHTLRIGGGRRA